VVDNTTNSINDVPTPATRAHRELSTFVYLIHWSPAPLFLH